MPYVTQNSQQIFYTYNGTTAPAPAIVLVHGAGGSHREWPQAWQQPPGATATAEQKTLTEFPVYALNLPGHHRSDPPSRSSVDDYAQDVMDFIETLGLEKVVIVGHSMGGAIAQVISLHQPLYLAGLVLVGTGARLPVNEMLLNGLLTDFPGTARLIVKFAWHKETNAYFKQQASQRLLNTPPAVVHGDFLACDAFDMSDRLDQIKAPTLVVGSSVDKMTPLTASQFLVDRIPNAQLAVIEGAGHYMAMEQTSQVTEAMVEFLKEI